jgi:light-regulated signal transduction histidine kinase (bacteriophytochrome)
MPTATEKNEGLSRHLPPLASEPKEKTRNQQLIEELAFQNEEKEDRAAELIIANRELVFQNEEKEKRAAELIIANKELVFQNAEKEKRAAELIVANKELAFQNKEKEMRAAELMIANKELANDISERKRVELELSNLATQLKRSNAELQDFASVASHDLQEPLRKIQAFGDRLRVKCADNLSADGLVYLDRMQDAAGRMQVLINDLLKFARITIAAKPFEPVDLQIIAEGVLSDLETRIENTKGKVVLDKLGTIDADPTQMRQLIQNLVGNALKFGREGVPPVVKVSGRLEPGRPAPDGLGGSYDNYKLTVEDNGIGFEAKYVDRIFKVFQRLHGRTEYEGTGIGLAVCRKIIERHGGTISVVSIPEKGTTFTVDLPVHHAGEIINEYF